MLKAFVDFVMTVLMAIPVYVVIRHQLPTTIEGYEFFSAGAVAAMISSAWLNTLQLKK